MKKLFFLLCACSLSGAALGIGPEANIVPRPASVVPGEGTFTLTASTVIGHGPRRPTAERRRTLRRSRRTGARRPHEKRRRRCRQPDDRRYADRRSVCARNHAVGRHGPRRHGAGRILRPAKPASARRERLRGPARRDGERPSVLRAPRRHARLRPLFLDPGPSQRIHRHPRPAQDEPFPLAPDRRSGLAHRNQEIPRTDPRRVGAPGRRSWATTPIRPNTTERPTGDSTPRKRSARSCNTPPTALSR